MVFEVGKCYEHTTGKKMRIISEVDTYFYGHGLLAETNTGQYEIVGMKEEHTINWKECDDFAEEVFGIKQKKLIREFSKMSDDDKFRVRYQQEPVSPDKLNICPKCNGTGLNVRGKQCLKCYGTGHFRKGELV